MSPSLSVRTAGARQSKVHRPFVAFVVAVLAAFAVAGTATAATPIDPPQPPAATPDLAFLAASPTGFTLRNNPCGFVVNPCRGGTASSILVLVSWNAGVFGQRTSWLSFPSLADGASIRVDYAAIGLVPYDMPCGSLTLLADPVNFVTERNEQNNTRTVTVGPYIDCV